MANLTFNEKQLIESVFGMGSGYVLNFSNRVFEDFMYDVTQYKIYTKYSGLSKAKMFREFLKVESEPYVGKAIVMMINYMKENNLISDYNKNKVDNLYELGKKYLGKSKTSLIRKQQNSYSQKKSLIDYESLNKSLVDLEKITNPQTRGYTFENYLNLLFNAFELEPHASYRTEFDQIDGSFLLDGDIVLIEAKYRTNQIPKDDLILFTHKIELKSHYAKGLFITYSQIDNKAVDYFTDRSSRFVVFTVEELFLMCQNKISLSTVLHGKFRFLDEKGLIFKHIMTL